MNDLVHLRVQVGVLLRQRLRSVFLVEAARVSLRQFHGTVLYRGSETYISCVLWYAQNASARPAHSMIVFGSNPLNTLVL